MAFARLEATRRSVPHRPIQAWNGLPADIRRVVDAKEFKGLVRAMLVSPPKANSALPRFYSVCIFYPFILPKGFLYFYFYLGQLSSNALLLCLLLRCT